MSDVSGRHIIQLLQKRWNLQLLAAHLLLAIAFIILLSAIVVKTIGVSWIVLSLIFIASLAIIYFVFIKKISEQDVTRFLNDTFPELQESTQLLLQPSDTLNGLERLQVRKVEHTLNENMPAPQLIRDRIKASVLILSGSLLLTLILFLIPFHPINSLPLLNNSSHNIYTSQPEKKLPEIKDVIVKITPPSYTGRKRREQDLFNIVAEQKAAIAWNITTTQKATKFNLFSMINQS